MPFLILGAGLAGLAAADELTRRGREVLVVEARSRAGGRVFTLREPFDDGLHAEAGAMYVGSADEHVRRYVHELGLEFDAASPAPAGGSIFLLRGRRFAVAKGSPVAWPFELTGDERAAGFAGLWKQHVRPLVDRYVVAAEEKKLVGLENELDAMSFAEALRRSGASTGVVAVFQTGYLEMFGDGFETVSAHAVVRELAHGRLSLKRSAGFDRIGGGSDRLPRALAARLGARIRYETRVDRIEQSPDGVEVSVVGPKGPSLVFANRVLAALPPRVLSAIVGAGLPEERRQKLRALGSTSVVRVFFQCRRRFWQERGEAGAASTDLGVRWIVDDTVAQPGVRGVVSAYVTANKARQLTELDEKERVRVAAADVGAAHPDLPDNLERTASHCWDSDPFAQGAHAAPGPGQLSLVRRLSDPEGRIYFAGEHLSDRPGWMEGAIISGLRSARELG